MHLSLIRGAWPLLALALAVFLDEDGAAQGKKKRPPRRPVPVVTALVQVASSQQTIELTGRARPVRIAQISSDVPGKVVRIFKRTGDSVKKGEALALQDNLSLKLRLAVSKARFKRSMAMQRQAKRNAQRTQSLRKQQVVSAKEFEESQDNMTSMETSFAVDAAELRNLRKQVALLTLRAPFAGQVVEADLEEGQWLPIGKTVYRVYGSGAMEIALGVPSRYLGLIARNAGVAVFFPEAKLRLKGQIVGVVNHVRHGSADFVLRVRVRNPENKPLSGLHARVSTPITNLPGAVVVPRDALVRSANGKVHVVVVVSQNKAKIVAVNPQGGAPHGGVLVKAKGLAVGQQIVVQGNERLQAGAAVRPILKDTTPPSNPP